MVNFVSVEEARAASGALQAERATSASIEANAFGDDEEAKSAAQAAEAFEAAQDERRGEHTGAEIHGASSASEGASRGDATTLSRSG